MDREKEIREAIYEVYNILKEVANTNSGKRMLSPDIVEKLCYSKDEVRKALEGKSITNKKQPSEKISIAISKIKDEEGVRKIYYEEIIKLFDPKVGQSTKSTIEKKLKRDDLVYLYSLISSVGVQGSKKKGDIFQMFKEYYDDEVRTAAMNRKLSGR